ncbi:MAG TPA: hypothetical protein VF066_02265 [Thermoleophilaceae bacterium]
MRRRGAVIAVCAALAFLSAPALAAPVALDPSVAGQGTTLLIAADASSLTSGGQSADAMTVALDRGMRFDKTSRVQLCSRSAARRAACPLESRIGFGRYLVAVRGYLLGAGDAQLTWSLDAYLGEPLRARDPASVVVIANLLGADSVGALLEPALGTSVPRRTTTLARVVQARSGAYGVELQFPKLPVQFGVAAPATATPTTLELALSAVRRTREDFVRRFKIRTLDGYEVRKVRDHRLVGHHLFRTPRSCAGSWRSELRVGFPDGVKRSASAIACTKAAPG